MASIVVRNEKRSGSPGPLVIIRPCCPIKLHTLIIQLNCERTNQFTKDKDLKIRTVSLGKDTLGTPERLAGRR